MTSYLHKKKIRMHEHYDDEYADDEDNVQGVSINYDGDHHDDDVYYYY